MKADVRMEVRSITLEEWKKFLTPEHVTAVSESIGSYNGPLTGRDVFDMIVRYEGGVASG